MGLRDGPIVTILRHIRRRRAACESGDGGGEMTVALEPSPERLQAAIMGQLDSKRTIGS
jgi:hypothetical protein